MPELQRRFGRQLSGEDTEASCFEPDGSRRWSDPSGVGHVISICMGEARFADRRGGNCVIVGGAGASEPFLGVPLDKPFQFVEISGGENCE